MAKIVAGQTSAVVIGGHDLWAFYDDNGKLIQQINGFASNNGVVTTTALTGTLVATYAYKMPDFTVSSPQQVVLQGTMDQLMPYWDAAKACADSITQLALSYEISYQNSNSVYSTIGACMNLTAPNVGAWYTPTPGLDNILLNNQVISAIIESHGLGAGGSHPLYPIYPQPKSTSPAIGLIGQNIYDANVSLA